jgi:hypothetical protein
MKVKKKKLSKLLKDCDKDELIDFLMESGFLTYGDLWRHISELHKREDKK